MRKSVVSRKPAAGDSRSTADRSQGLLENYNVDVGDRDYRVHDNRHIHASQLVSSGISLAILGRLLGHTNPITTHLYARLADDPLREAAEIMAKKMR